MNDDRKTKTFHISTFGCQMNLADSSTLVSSLLTRGFERVENESEADFLILNTCSVRDKAEQRVLGRLHELKKFKKGEKKAKIAVVGCMAQRLGSKLVEMIPHVDFVLGTDRLFELPDVFDGLEGISPINTAFGHENMDTIEPTRDNEYSAFVTISRGCDNYCSYCIVPFVRGRERAHDPDRIVANVNSLVDQGVVEITLLGQNVNSYLHGDTDFPRLLHRVISETDVQRIRYMTSHPKDLSDSLIDIMAAEPKLMPHIHLPLQSGSDRILGEMGRKYTLDHYRKIVGRIRSRLDYVALTTDLIVGFPSETKEDYDMTLEAVQEFQYDTAFMFRYSIRPGTKASKLEDDVPEQEKISRLSRLIDIQQKIGYTCNQREIGRTCNALVEGYSRRSNDLYRARTEGNKIVLFGGENVHAGQLLPIRINSADAFTLHGELVRETV